MQTDLLSLKHVTGNVFLYVLMFFLPETTATSGVYVLFLIQQWGTLSLPPSPLWGEVLCAIELKT